MRRLMCAFDTENVFTTAARRSYSRIAETPVVMLDESNGVAQAMRIATASGNQSRFSLR